MSIADKTKLDNFANSRIITIAEGRYNEDDDVDEFTNVPFSTIKAALDAGELIAIYTSENGSAYENSCYYEGFNEYYYPIFVSSTAIKFQTLPRGSYGGYYTLTIDTNGIAPIRYSNIDRNTTYTLSKSGTDIVLTGSDGSKSAVTDATGSGTSTSGIVRKSTTSVNASSVTLPDAKFYLVTMNLSLHAHYTDTFILDWYGLYDAWSKSGTSASFLRQYPGVNSFHYGLQITAYNSSTQKFTIKAYDGSDGDGIGNILRVSSFS
jgi:hypothetical protein